MGLKRSITKLVERNDVEGIIQLINEREKAKLELINKLQRKQDVTIKKINGALRQTINCHGPITKELIGSASKRIMGNILSNHKKNILDRLLNLINIR